MNLFRIRAWGTPTHVQDFTSGGLRDILINVEGLYDQTLTYGLELISVTTVANAGAEPSVQLAASAILRIQTASS
ncbi:MAG: hypothetical protein LBK23_03805 [Oscillospiraceae bacterium]|nr:hypothetical protein [Oscillospiraceae bacterium]